MWQEGPETHTARWTRAGTGPFAGQRATRRADPHLALHSCMLPPNWTAHVRQGRTPRSRTGLRWEGAISRGAGLTRKIGYALSGSFLK